MKSKLTDSIFKRKHVRAPMKSFCLFIDGEYVLKAKTLNISEGGILLSELPHVPDTNSLPLMFAMPILPRLSSLTMEQLKEIDMNDLPRHVLRVKVRMVRLLEGQSNVDRVFANQIGCEFYSSSKEYNDYITSYIETFTKNMIYLLSLFESLNNRPEQIETMRVVAHLLGYDKSQKVPLLRAKVLHDYQSLEGL